jgi:glycosyltransferase involved in cell wall biosynthesis
VALVHDWLCGYRGGEAVLERLALLVREHFEPAGLFVMFDDGRPVAPTVDAMGHHVSALGRLPGASGGGRRWLLPVYPAAVSSISRQLARLHARSPVDLVVSSSSAAVKGVRAPRGVAHLCYCHSPARYLWGRGGAYAGPGARGTARGIGLRVFGSRLRRWDQRTSVNVSRFVANSSFTAGEVRRCYARDAVVVYPPVRTEFFTPSASVRREGFWLVAGALEPYKRVDRAMAAARAAGKRLVVAGTGSQEGELRAAARIVTGSGGIEFVGRVSDEALRDLYRRAEVLIFPQVEDFGITAVEAQACGLPVVARGAGGALDSVIPGVTGALFTEESAEAIRLAVAEAPRGADVHCRRNAERFGGEAFDAAMLEQMEELLRRDDPASAEEARD